MRVGFDPCVVVGLDTWVVPGVHDEIVLLVERLVAVVTREGVIPDKHPHRHVIVIRHQMIAEAARLVKHCPAVTRIFRPSPGPHITVLKRPVFSPLRLLL